MIGPVLVVLDHDRGELDESSLQTITMCAQIGSTAVHVAVVGGAALSATQALGIGGIDSIWLIEHESLSDFAPEAWGDAVVGLARHLEVRTVVGIGTERGSEVLAHVAAGFDAPFISNIIAVDRVDPLELTRARWGGSLLERVAVDFARQESSVTVMSAAPFAFATPEALGDTDDRVAIQTFTPELPANASRTRVKHRITLLSGITLQTAPVVVSGGRGVGSAEGFAPLEQLAELLGGAVGCSRVVTNQGWRPHSDQVGQTGKRVAPDLYIACGISGAIQHWIGMQAAQRVLAINLDKDAPMVAKADYAVIGDLHEVIPAIVAELKRRRA